MIVNKFISLVYDWTMGVVMIGIFALVCIILIGIIINLMNSENKKNDTE
ncbi:hypothetical protein [Winogradskyella sp. UBA3174]|mgnify:CR=1 FL=1|nr:hypothetical protein [Winogradskyella sp. UBA3174]